MLAAVALRLLLELMHSKDLAALDRAYASAQSPGVSVTAVYRLRRLRMNPTAAEEARYFDSLPSTQAELDRIYEDLTYDRTISEDPVISDVVDNMYDTAAAIAHKRHRGYEKFIRLVLFANADVGEIAWPVYDDLLEEDTAAMFAALRALSKEERLRICRNHDPRELTQLEALVQCHTDD